MKQVVSVISFLIVAYLLYSNADLSSLSSDSSRHGGFETFREIDSPSIGLWNVQTFGDSKASGAFYDDIVGVISLFDIIVVQEIRDKDGSVLRELCDDLDGYVCYNSSRAGRSTSKEQYALFVREGVRVGGFVDYTASMQSDFERPPWNFWVVVGDKNITVWTSHIKPTDAKNELEIFENVVSDTEVGVGVSDPVVVLGDFNADCSYYDEDERGFADWDWHISNDMDTTLAYSDCTYDRILSRGLEVTQVGVLKEGIVQNMSDHYPVWISVEI